MAKIPRTNRGLAASDFTTFTPSKAVLAPMDLVDYSGLRGGLETGAKYSADRYFAEKDIEARTYTKEFINSGDLLLQDRLDIYARNATDTSEEQAEKSFKEWKSSLGRGYDEKVVENMTADRKAAFYAARDLLNTKFKAGVRKMRTKNIVDNQLAQYEIQEQSLLAELSNPNIPFNGTLVKYRDFFAGRVEEARVSGGPTQVENSNQVQQRWTESLKKIGEVLLERFSSDIYTKATKGLIKSSEDLRFSWNQDNSIGGKGGYASYLDLIKGIESGDFDLYFPSRRAAITKLNKELHSALRDAGEGRDKALKREANALVSSLVAANKPVTSVQRDQVIQAYTRAGMQYSPLIDQNLAKIGAQPNARDKDLYNAFIKEVLDPAYAAELDYGIAFDIAGMRTKLTQWLNGEGVGHRGETLHPFYYNELSSKVNAHSSSQRKEINDNVKDIMDYIRDSYKLGPKSKYHDDAKYDSWKALNGTLTKDISFIVRDYVRNAYKNASAGGKEYDNESVRTDVMNLIDRSVSQGSMSSARIDIPLDKLEQAYQTELENPDDLTSYDRFLMRMAKIRIQRWNRFAGDTNLNKKQIDGKTQYFINNEGTGFVSRMADLRKKQGVESAKYMALEAKGKKNWHHQYEFMKGIPQLQSLMKKYTTVEEPYLPPQNKAIADQQQLKDPSQSQTAGAATGAITGLVDYKGEPKPPDIGFTPAEEYFNPDMPTEEYFNPNMPRLTNELLGHTADGRPLWKNEPEIDKEGWSWDSESSERATIIEVDGKYYSYPTLFNRRNAVGDLEPYEVTVDEAREKFIENDGIDPETGIKAKPFDDLDEAEAYRAERSQHLSDHLRGKGDQKEQDTTMQEITSLRAQGKKTEAIVVALDKITGFSDMLAQTGQDASEVGAAIVDDLAGGWKTVAGVFHAASGDIEDAQNKFLDYLLKKLKGTLGDDEKIPEIEEKLTGKKAPVDTGNKQKKLANIESKVLSKLATITSKINKKEGKLRRTAKVGDRTNAGDRARVKNSYLTEYNKKLGKDELIFARSIFMKASADSNTSKEARLEAELQVKIIDEVLEGKP